MDHGVSGFSSENFSLHSEGGRPEHERRCLTKTKHYTEKPLDSGRSKVDGGECSSCQEPSTEVPGGRRGGQLPPKQEEYPPLSRPGDRPLVVCQHCSTLLVVRTNLPLPRKSTQKLRCARCIRISTFAVPKHSTDQELHRTQEDLVDSRSFSHQENQQHLDEQNSKDSKSDSLLGEISEGMGEDYSCLSDMNSSSSPPSSSTLTSPGSSSSTLTSPASRERRCSTKSKHYYEKLLDSGRSNVDDGECSSCQEPITEVTDGRRRGQLPPKQEKYPPLPRPDARSLVVCQHCFTLLVVPTNLPPPRKRTQKLRCGACMRISIFSVQWPLMVQESHGVLSKLGHRDVRLKEGHSDDARCFSGLNVNLTRGLLGSSLFQHKSLSRGKQELSGSNWSSTSNAEYGAGSQSPPHIKSLKEIIMSPSNLRLMKFFFFTLFDVSPAGAFLDVVEGLPASTDSKKQSSNHQQK